MSTRATRAALHARPQASLAAVVGALLAVLAVETRDIWPMILACAITGTLVMCAGSLFVSPIPTVLVHAGKKAVAGEQYAIRIVVTNGGRARSRPVLITQSLLPYLDPGRGYVDALDPGERVSLTLTRTVRQRGYAQRARLEINILGAFGLFYRCQHGPLAMELYAVPAFAQPVALPYVPSTAHDGRTVASAGEHIRGIREWRAGDSPRQVHWRSTARTGALTVIERDEPIRGQLVLVIVGEPGDPAFESELAIGFATATSALHEGTAVSALWKPPSGGRWAGCAIEVATSPLLFAKLPAADAPDAAELAALARIVSPGAAVLVVAPTDNTATRESLADVLRGRASVVDTTGATYR